MARNTNLNEFRRQVAEWGVDVNQATATLAGKLTKTQYQVHQLAITP